MFEDNSFDALITDHPYKLDKSLKGGNRDFASYDSFMYTQKDIYDKAYKHLNIIFIIAIVIIGLVTTILT